MKLRNILLILAFLSLASISMGGYIYYSSLKESTLEQIHQKVISRTRIIALHIDSTLAENQKSVKALAGLKELHQALEDRDERKILKANMILDHFHKALNVEVCYLMDEQGNTVASSNRAAPDSFVGKNYAFRPYFQKAKQGVPSIYMALGVTSGK
jgi:C4-dicarboxylate-specific signal transduction histidine kinase